MSYLPDIYKHFERAFPTVHAAHQELARTCYEVGPLDERSARLVKLGIAIGARASALPPALDGRARCLLLPARPLLLLLHLQADHWRLHSGSEGYGVRRRMLLRLPCHAESPQSRARDSERSHVTGRGPMALPCARITPRQNAREFREIRCGRQAAYR
jgi:hypothetical protein